MGRTRPFRAVATKTSSRVFVPHRYDRGVPGPARRYTDGQLIEAVATARSIAQVLKVIGLRAAGGNYANVKRRINELGLDTTHFQGQGWLWGTHIRTAPIRSLDEILVEGSFYKSHDLKRRLIATGIKTPICEVCGRDLWNGRPIPLELDHLNGIRSDNRLINLRIVCPNCHAQTATYRGKNIKSTKPP